MFVRYLLFSLAILSPVAFANPRQRRGGLQEKILVPETEVHQHLMPRAVDDKGVRVPDVTVDDKGTVHVGDVTVPGVTVDDNGNVRVRGTADDNGAGRHTGTDDTQFDDNGTRHNGADDTQFDDNGSHNGTDDTQFDDRRNGTNGRRNGTTTSDAIRLSSGVGAAILAILLNY